MKNRFCIIRFTDGNFVNGQALTPERLNSHLDEMTTPGHEIHFLQAIVHGRDIVVFLSELDDKKGGK